MRLHATLTLFLALLLATGCQTTPAASARQSAAMQEQATTTLHNAATTICM